MSDCPQSVFVSVLLDGELSPEEHEEFSRHLEICPYCSSELENLRSLRSKLESLPSDSSARLRVFQALDSSLKFWPQWYDWHLPWPLAACLAVLFIVSLMFNAYFIVGWEQREAAATRGLAPLLQTPNKQPDREVTEAIALRPGKSIDISRAKDLVHSEKSNEGGHLKSTREKLPVMVRQARTPLGTGGRPLEPEWGVSSQLYVSISSIIPDQPTYQISSGRNYQLNKVPIIHVANILSSQN